MYQRILVPVDGSSTSMLGLAEGIKLAKEGKAKLRILHVVDEYIGDASFGTAVYYDKWLAAIRAGGRKVLNEAKQFAMNSDFDADAVLIDTIGRRAADVIVEQAKIWPADLIVIGTHGRRGLSRLVMGSDAELVVRETPVPILLVRGTDE